MPGITDIEARGRRLFDPFKRASKSPLQIRLGSIKTLTRNRSASSVAAYLSRQANYQRLRPDERRALRRINKQYFDLRRALFSDARLTRQDKTQLVSVLSFERMKAREAIHNPQHNYEVSLMGSAEIRKLIIDDQDDPGFSISGPKGSEPEGVRVRVKRILDKVSLQLDPAVKTERERELNAKDLYTRKAKFSQNVHYLDKKTSKTLFVDTGKAIAMRRTGITEAGVAVALQLAKERFGSTLTINGSDEFKKLVIDAVAKNGMDIHFTDKSMNESLTARRAELEIEREELSISPAPAPAPAPAESVLPVEPTAVTTPTSAATAPAATPAEPAVPAAPVVSPETAGTAVPAAPATSTEAHVDDLVARDALWLADLQLTADDMQRSETAMGLRGNHHAMWLVGADQATSESVEMIKSFLANDAYRGSFKFAVDELYGNAHTTDEVQLLDKVTGFVVEEVNRIEGGPAAAVQSTQPTGQAPTPAGRKVIEGVLVAHGAAPYQYDPEKQPSYFVTMKTERGDRTVWGVGLADAMQNTVFEPGDRIRLEDHGTEPVTVEVPEADGSATQKTTYRRAWTAEGLGTAREVASSAAVVSVSIPAPDSPEEQGPEMA